MHLFKARSCSRTKLTSPNANGDPLNPEKSLWEEKLGVEAKSCAESRGWRRKKSEIGAWSRPPLIIQVNSLCTAILASREGREGGAMWQIVAETIGRLEGAQNMHIIEPARANRLERNSTTFTSGRLQRLSFAIR